MKKLILIVLSGFLFNFNLIAQTAVDFTTNDCNGNSHHLYSELDSGKVIVIAWVMPCGSCGVPSKAAYDAVQSFASSHPGVVRFYLADDYANTNCASLTNWGVAAGMVNAVVFSNSAVSMSGYGAPGMPKIVVLGGDSSHTVFFNQNSGVNQSNVTAAINTALTATGIDNIANNEILFELYPVPANKNITINYTINNASSVEYKIFNVLGEEVLSSVVDEMNIGKNSSTIDVSSLSSGTYIFQLTINNSSKQLKFTISK